MLFDKGIEIVFVLKMHFITDILLGYGKSEIF